MLHLKFIDTLVAVNMPKSVSKNTFYMSSIFSHKYLFIKTLMTADFD